MWPEQQEERQAFVFRGEGWRLDSEKEEHTGTHWSLVQRNERCLKGPPAVPASLSI